MQVCLGNLFPLVDEILHQSQDALRVLRREVNSELFVHQVREGPLRRDLGEKVPVAILRTGGPDLVQLELEELVHLLNGGLDGGR